MERSEGRKYVCSQPRISPFLSGLLSSSTIVLHFSSPAEKADFISLTFNCFLAMKRLIMQPKWEVWKGARKGSERKKECETGQITKKKGKVEGCFCVPVSRFLMRAKWKICVDTWDHHSEFIRAPVLFAPERSAFRKRTQFPSSFRELTCPPQTVLMTYCRGNLQSGLPCVGAIDPLGCSVGSSFPPWPSSIWLQSMDALMRLFSVLFNGHVDVAPWWQIDGWMDPCTVKKKNHAQ